MPHVFAAEGARQSDRAAGSGGARRADQSNIAEIQARADDSVPVAEMDALVQRVPESVQGNGLPTGLRRNMEAMSGLNLSGVAVHRNSDEPAKVGAEAFARGGDIHLAPGKDQHLPHEAWHVVQQASGRVKPTMQLTSGVSVNDDPSLEAEADRMGAKAAAAPTQGDNQKG